VKKKNDVKIYKKL